jgi:hypothetical protein
MPADDATRERMDALLSLPFAPSKLVVENDNPAWSALMRYGEAIRDKSPRALEHGCTDACRVQSMTREGRFHLQLALGTHRLEWEGHVYPVAVSAPGGSDSSREVAEIGIASPEAFAALERFLHAAREHSRSKQHSEGDKVVARVLSNGIWKSCSSYPKRPAGSLITVDGAVEALLADMRAFVDGEEAYVRYGLPFKRNYLLIGPPGSGKSSLISVAAGELDLDVCFITVTAATTEKDLCAAIVALSASSLLVLEDAEVLCSAGTPGSDQALSVLTNVLDGTLHKHKLLTVLTSAYPERLDDVLTRHGRIDYTCRLQPLCQEQVRRMAASTFPAAPGPEVTALAARMWGALEGSPGVTTASVVSQFLFRHRNDPPSAIGPDTCAEMLRGTRTEHLGDCSGYGYSSSSMYM